MSVPRHTPFDGSSKLFQIGLKPLDPAAWIDVDDRLPAYLVEQARLFRERPDELLARLGEYLPARCHDIYQRDDEAMRLVDRVVPFVGDDPPLLVAARLVQDDLVLMRRGENGWRLAAASLCFPSSWSLAEKFGRPIHEVHGPVPGFGGGTRNADLIARMFDNLRPETPVILWNWSLYGDDRLFHPDVGRPDERRFGDAARAEHIHLRSERQTLRRLPQSGDIV